MFELITLFEIITITITITTPNSSFAYATAKRTRSNYANELSTQRARPCPAPAHSQFSPHRPARHGHTNVPNYAGRSVCGAHTFDADYCGRTTGIVAYRCRLSSRPTTLTYTTECEQIFSCVAAGKNVRGLAPRDKRHVLVRSECQ